MVDTINATYNGGIDVPLDDFSTANISTLSETTKLFSDFNIKKQRGGKKSHLSYVPSFYNNYITYIL
jgi:hypothetical protein